MKWILVLHMIMGGKQIEMRSESHPEYAECEKARLAWTHVKGVKVLSSECVQAK